MTDIRGLGKAALQAAAAMLGRIAANLPGIIAAFLLVPIGWALARVMRAATA